MKISPIIIYEVCMGITGIFVILRSKKRGCSIGLFDTLLSATLWPIFWGISLGILLKEYIYKKRAAKK